MDDVDAEVLSLLHTPIGFRSRFRAYRAAAFNFSGGIDPLQCEAEDYDTLGEYTAAPDYWFTPQRDGYYYLAAHIAWNGAAGLNVRHRLTIKESGGNVIVSGLNYEVPVGGAQYFGVSTIQRLLHTIHYNVEIGTGAARVGVPGIPSVWFLGWRLADRDW